MKLTPEILKFLIWCVNKDCAKGSANSQESFAQKLFDYIQDWELHGNIREPIGLEYSFVGAVAKNQGLTWQQLVDYQLTIGR